MKKAECHKGVLMSRARTLGSSYIPYGRVCRDQAPARVPAAPQPPELAVRSPGSALTPAPGEHGHQQAGWWNNSASPKPQDTGVKCRRMIISSGRGAWPRSKHR